MKRHNEAGFSLLEVIVVIAVSAILIGAAVNSYIKIALINKRQERVIQVERELSRIHDSLAEELHTKPGRELGVYLGTAKTGFIIPAMPANGTITNPNGHKTPIQLGLVTPFKVNGKDAFTVVYAKREVPRLELVEPANETPAGSGTGVARVVAAGLTIQPGRAVTIFSPGDLYLLMGATPPNPKAYNSPSPVYARLVRLLAAGQVVQGGTPERDCIELSFDYCDSGACATMQFGTGANLSYMLNTPTNKTIKSFGTGSALVPVGVTHFYVDPGQGRSRVMRVEGGAILPDPNGNFKVVDGIESFLGEADDFQVSYIQTNGTTNPTPASPIGVPWLQDIASVQVMITRTIPAPVGNEVISRSVTIDYPITIKTLE